ncbi:MAG: hypothetical protein M3N93_11255 [Acidobacteriota bacterium]|nr:hypothetical protein [Acidobacteriota bacterium]
MKKLESIVAASLAALLLQYSPATAAPKPTTKEFAASCSSVWDSAKVVVPKHYLVLSMSAQDHTGAFEIGNGVLTVRRALAFSMTGSGDTCTVAITGHFSGLANNDKGDFFKRIQDGLAVKTEATASK